MFEGVYTAIVTPFTASGAVDYDRLAEHVDRQVKSGVDGVVPVGTTGESPTVNPDEHVRIIQTTVQAANKRIKIVAGTGANSTEEALELTSAAKELGVDGTLQVTPYYNKPNRSGLVQHFTRVADLGVPVMLYNVPGRSAKALSIDLIAELSEHDHIVSVKEAGGSADRVSQILTMCDIDVVSGDDPLTLPMMAVGAVGVVSVASNIVPEIVCDIVNSAANGDFVRARQHHLEYHRLFSGMFMETNPIPVKTALAMLGRMEEEFRLPLAPLEETEREKLEKLLTDYNLL